MNVFWELNSTPTKANLQLRFSTVYVHTSMPAQVLYILNIAAPGTVSGAEQ